MSRNILRKRKNIGKKILKIWKYPFVDIRHIERPTESVVAIYDKREAYFFTEPKAGFKDSPTLWSDNPSLVNIASQYFEFEWKQSLKKTSPIFQVNSN